MNDTAVRRARWLAPALLALGSLGCAAAWILIALSTGRLCAWMALLAALDAAVLLRLARMPASIRRSLRMPSRRPPEPCSGSGRRTDSCRRTTASSAR